MTDHIGLYWTRAVPWAGFKGVSRDVDVAAGESRTIRYQRDLVRRHVGDARGTLIAELILTDPAPDRASPETVADLRGVLRDAAKDTVFTFVDFAAVHGWRSHPYLLKALDGRRTEALYPDPLLIDGQTFDPIVHFRQWREIDRVHQATKHDRAVLVMAALVGSADRSWPDKAEVVNKAGLRTQGGRPWTGDNLRKFLKQMG